MPRYRYILLENDEYLYYAIATELSEGELHIYLLDPEKGSKEFILHKNQAGSYETPTGVSDGNYLLEALNKQLHAEPIQQIPGDDNKVNLREGMFYTKLKDGFAFIHPEYFGDAFDAEGVEPTGIYIVQAFKEDGVKLYFVEPDVTSGTYILSPGQETEADALELYTVNDAIKYRFAEEV